MSDQQSTIEEIQLASPSADEVDKQLMGKESPEDIAAAYFSLNQPKLKKAIDQMSLRQIRRLFWNLASYPFVPEEQKLKSDEEKSAFYVANEMISNKTIMLLHYEMQKVEEAQRKEQELKQNEVTTNEESENGKV